MSLRKEVDTRCPHCGTKLLVDVATGHVLRKEVPGEAGAKPKAEQFDAAVKGRESRSKAIDDTFGGALREESEKKKKLEEAFERAKKKAAETGEEPPPPSGYNW